MGSLVDLLFYFLCFIINPQEHEYQTTSSRWRPADGLSVDAGRPALGSLRPKDRHFEKVARCVYLFSCLIKEAPNDSNRCQILEKKLC